MISKFYQKLKDLSIEKGGKFPNIIEALAEMDYSPKIAEKVKHEYYDLMTSGKNNDKGWAKRVSKIVNKIQGELNR